MIPSKEGQIVKFHTVGDGEDPNQRYVVLEVHTDCERPRAKIKALSTGLPFSSVHIVSVNDLEIVPVPTDDLIGYVTFVRKDDGTKILGKILSVDKSEIYTEMVLSEKTVETNVIVVIEDKYGDKHRGTLVV